MSGYRKRDFPLYEDVETNWQFPQTDDIEKLPDLSSLAILDNDKGKGKGKRLESGSGSGSGLGLGSGSMKVTTKIKQIKCRWLSNGKPHLQLQNIMRGIVLDIIRQGVTEGTFTIDDVSFENDIVRVAIKSSKTLIYISLLKVAKILFKIKTNPAELQLFYDAINSYNSTWELERFLKLLYVHPILSSPCEAVYFLLDVEFIAKKSAVFNQGIKRALLEPYDTSPMVSRVKQVKEMKEKVNIGDRTVHGVLKLIKAYYHHHRHMDKNVSVEDIYALLREEISNAHIKVVLILNANKFDCGQLLREIHC